jgi:hypothetical protein
MKTNNLNRPKNSAILIFTFFIISMGLFSSCKQNDEIVGEPYFTIEDNPTGLSTGIAGETRSFVVRSNRPWQVVAQGEYDWVQAFPAEGVDDGIFKIIVSKNSTFETRTMNFAFVVDGVEQPVLFRVDQEQAVPAMEIKELAGINLNQATQDFKVNVEANVTYTYTSDAEWCSFVKAAVGTVGTELTFTVSANESANSRTANIAFVCAAFPALNATVTVKQEGKNEGTIVLFENFNWLAYGSPIFYTTTNETRMDVWTDAEKAMGWTSTPNPGSSDQPMVYARQGFVKLGKTGYGGNLITPKLSALTGSTNLLVKFKAVPYMTAAGTKDDNILNVSLIGPGTISTTTFTIDNWPDYATDATCTAIWENIATERSFTITGATSETQIEFLGGGFNLVGVGAGKNRIFLDDIKVLIPN